MSKRSKIHLSITTALLSIASITKRKEEGVPSNSTLNGFNTSNCGYFNTSSFSNSSPIIDELPAIGTDANWQHLDNSKRGVKNSQGK